MSKRRFYDTRQAAKMFKVSSKTIRNWIEEGKFPNAERLEPGNPKSYWVIPAEDIEALKNLKGIR